MLTLAKSSRRLVGEIRERVFPRERFFRKVSGVIHVGANTGQERELYARFDLDVIWIEPIPSVFERLRLNLVNFPRQRAYQYLLTDQDEHEYEFHVASNEGASSSILPLTKNRQMWPEVYYTNDIMLKSSTLATFVETERIDLGAFQALVLDTQGSELMILKGAQTILPRFRFVKVEVSDFEYYEGSCLINELAEFMNSHGFRELQRDAFNSVKGVGTYFDVVYERTGAGNLAEI